MTRLTAAFWVQAYLRRLALENIPAYILAHGDDTAGAVLVKLATLDGQARLFQRGFDLQTGIVSGNSLNKAQKNKLIQRCSDNWDLIRIFG